MEDNVSKLYKKALDKGILRQGLTEDMFREQISTEDGLRSFYDYAVDHGMRFHEYNEFKQRFRGNATPAQPATPSTPASPAQKGVWSRILGALNPNAPTYRDQPGVSYPINQQGADKEAQLRREQAATLPLSDADRQRQAEINLLGREDIENRLQGNSLTFGTDPQTGLPTITKTTGHAQLYSGVTPRQEQINQLKLQSPSYLAREENTIDDVMQNVEEAWSANTEEGRQARVELEQGQQNLINELRDVFNATERGSEINQRYANEYHQAFQSAYRTRLESEARKIAAQYQNGTLTEEQANAKLNTVYQRFLREFSTSSKAQEINTRLNEEYSSAFQDEMGSSYEDQMQGIAQAYNNKMLTANADYIRRRERELGMSNTEESVAEWKNRYADELQNTRRTLVNLNTSFDSSRLVGDPAERRRKAREWEMRYAEARSNNEMMNAANELIRDTEKLMSAVREHKTFPGGFIDGVTDISTWDLGLGDVITSYNLKQIVKKQERYEQSHREEDKLTAHEQMLLDAAAIHAMSQVYYADLVSRYYKAGQSTAVSIPYMLEFAAMPVEGVVNGTARSVLKYGIRNFGKKTIPYTFRKMLGRGAGSLVAAGMQTATFGGGHIAADYLRRTTGDIEARFDENGQIQFAGIKEGSGQGNGEALWNAITEEYNNNLGEIVLGSFTPLKRTRMVRNLFKSANSTQWGSIIKNFQKTPVAKAIDRTQWHGLSGEYVEENITNLLNFVDQGVGESGKWDAESWSEEGFNLDDQIDTFLALAPTSIFFGVLNTGAYYVPIGVDSIKLRRKLKTDAEKRMFDTILRESRSGDFGTKAHDLIRSIVTNPKFSHDAKYAMLEQIYSDYQAEVSQQVEETAVEEQPTQPQQPQDRQTQLRQQAAQQAQQEVQGMAHQDGNVYYVGIKGKDDAEGYAVSGALGMVTDKDGMYSTSGRDLVTVKMNDGSVQQVPADELVVRDIPVSADELMQERTDHYFAQYANEDLFHVGDKVYLKQNGQQSAESSTIVNINDEGIEVEIIGPNGQPDTTIIPHEKAAEALAVAEGETEDGIVTFNVPEGEPLRLRQVGDGVYETIEPVNGEMFTFTDEDLANMGAVRQPQGEAPVNTGDNGTLTPVVEQPSYPQDENGNPAWNQIEQGQAAQLLYDLFGSNRQSAQSYAEDMLKEAQKVQRTAAKQTSHNLNIAERIAEEEQNKQFRAQADAAVKYWENVKLAISQIKTAEELAAEQAQRDKDAAKAAARRQTEEGLVGGQPAERWNNAPKIAGNAVTRTLPDGTKITGHYVLAEAGAATPSHNPFNNWNTSEGFPVTEDGRNINDRDYKNDKDAQQITMQIAQTYDGQAVQQVPVVSSEGIVYDGNGRTIAGNIAAANNTDAAYLQALSENAANFGFTPEQVASMQHPRVYLQTDEDMPYNTTTFAKFNAQEKKTMDSVHRAISNAKKLTDAARDGLLRVINSYSSLDAFFASENGAKDILNLLQANNIITEQEAPEWRDKTENGFVLSADGRSGITDLLIGALFDEQTIRMLGNDKGLKQSILRAMPSIIENRQLGDYALTDDINEAIRLLYEARQADMVYKLFVRQGNLIDGYVKDRFSAFSMLLAEEMSSGVDKFRQALDVYNDSARDDANGQATMFEQRTPEDIKNEILKRYEQEQQPAEPAAEQPASEETQPPVSSTPASNEPAAEVTETPAEMQVETATEDELYSYVSRINSLGNYSFTLSDGDADVVKFAKWLVKKKPDDALKWLQRGNIVTNSFARKIYNACVEKVNKLQQQPTETPTEDNAHLSDNESAFVAPQMPIDTQTNAQKQTETQATEQPDITNESAQEFIGKDVADVRKALGHWWTLDSQNAGQYIFDRAGYGRLQLSTDEKGIVTAAYFVSHNGPAWFAAHPEIKEQPMPELSNETLRKRLAKLVNGWQLGNREPSDGEMQELRDECEKIVKRYKAPTIKAALDAIEESVAKQKAEGAAWIFTDDEETALYQVVKAIIGKSSNKVTKNVKKPTKNEENLEQNLQESEKSSTFAGVNNNQNGSNEENSNGGVSETGERESGEDRLQPSELGRGGRASQEDLQTLNELLNGKDPDEQQKIARQWAEEHGVLFDLFQLINEKGLTDFPGGNENSNWIDKQAGVIYKMNNLMNSKNRISVLLERVALYNQLFHDTRLEFVGLATVAGGRQVYPVYSQPYVADARNASKEEIDENMHAMGYEPTGKTDGEYSNEKYIIGDARPRNVLVRTDGNVFYVDVDVTLAPQNEPAPTKPKRKQEQTNAQSGTSNSATVSKQPRNQQQTNFESNSVFTADAVAEARKRLAARRNRLNMGLNPEDAYDYTIIAGAYVEQGVRKFADFCKAMIQDLGDAVRPYLQSIYDSLRHDPQVKAQGWNKDFDSHDIVDNFDVDNFAVEEEQPEEQLKAAFEVGQKVKYYNKVDKTYHDAEVESVNTDGTYNITTPSPIFGDIHMNNISEDRLSAIEEKPKEPEKKPAAERTLGTIRQSKNTKTGAEIYVVSLTDHVSNDEFKVLKTRARANGGYYSSFAKNRGFIFNTEEDAKRFNTINDEEVTDAQTSANTEAVISQAETVAAEAAAIGQDGEDRSGAEGEQRTEDAPASVGAVGTVKPQAQPELSPEEADAAVTECKEAISKIDDTVEHINEQLAVLGYYQADETKDFHEYYGYMKSAEKKAVADADKLGKQLATDLGIEVNKRKKVASANLSQIGGDVKISLPLQEGRELNIWISVRPNAQVTAADGHRDDGTTDSLVVQSIMWRVDHQTGYGSNNWEWKEVTYQQLLKNIRRIAKNYLPEVKPEQVDVPELPANPTMMDVVEQAKARKEAITKKRSKNSVQDGQQVLSLFDDVVDEINDGIAQENSTPAIAEQTEPKPVKNQTEFTEDDITPAISRVRLKDGSIKQVLMVTHTQDIKSNEKPKLEQIMFTDGTTAKFEDIAAINVDESVEDPRHGYKVGDEVIFRSKGSASRKPQKVKIVDFEKDGRPIVDSFGTNYITEIADWDDIEPINNEDNGSTEVRNDGERESSTPQGRTAGQPADQNGTLGGSQRQANEGTQSGGVGSRSEQHRVHDGERGLGTAGQRSTESVEEPVAEGERKNTHNFRYDPSDPAPTSNKARYEANLAAIRLLKQLQDEDRQATPEEQRVLAKFTGWGGLGEFFKGEPGTTYWSDHGEKSPYQVIKELLTDEEMQAAQLSRNSAYFTPPAIIDELWNVAKHLGFKGGNILEGSAGIGNILAQMPQSISDRSNLQAVEIDSITAGILAQLYPDAQVHAAGFQEVDIPNNSQDLVITNVPFVTGLRVYDKKEKDLSKRFGNIHDFCIAKNVRKLRQGGIGIFITSSGTLDNSKDLRRWLNNEGETDVIAAFRLNRETFGGTSATSDIIVVRKRVNGQKAPNPIDVLDTETARTAYYEEDGKEVGRKLIYNRYFVEHPESMGGEMGFGFEHGDTRWGGTTAGCYPVASINQTQRLQEWISRLDNTIHVPTYQELEQGALVSRGTYEEYEGAIPFGSLILNSKGEICQAYHGQAIPVEGINPTKVKGHTKAEVLTDYNALKAAVEELLAEQAKGISDEGLKGLLRKLNKVYDDFVKKYGNLNRNVSLSFLRNDVQWASMAALENVRETIDKSGKKKIEVSKTDVFSKRVVGVQAEPKAENARDGVILSVQQYGNVRPDMIATWLGRPQEEVEKEIIESRLAFRDPQTGNMVVSHEYLSGNVREKLAYAEEHNENGIYDTNIEELRKVIPVDIPAHLIEFNIGSTWIPVELYHQYLKEKFGVESLQLVHVGSAWISNEKSYGGYALRNEKNRAEGVYSEKLMEQVYGHQLMMAAMNNVPLVVSKVQKNYDGTTETITDKEATAACSDKISQIKDDFVEWARGKMQEDSELAERVQKIYNERFNAIVPMLSVDKAFLSPHLPGQNHKYTLYDHQQQAVVRATTQPVMLAHEVGTGKTITLISAAMEMRRLGTAKKPMIVVQNATTPQFVKEAKDLYPNAKILTVSERDRTKEGRQEFYAKIKYNDWDLIIVPQSVFDMIPDSESRMRDFIQEKIEEKLHAIEAAKEANVDEKVTKRMERELEALQEDLQNANMSGKRSKSKTEKDAKKDAERIENAKARAEEMLDRRTDEVEDFDDMGIDALLIDEAHNYKHLGFATMMTRGVKGIDPSYSKRAAALYLKCQSVYERCGHRNVVFATGTPISNTAAEIWTFMKYLMPKEVLKDNDIYYFDDFVHNFGKINEQLEFATNGKFKANNRFAQYGNVPELMRIWLTCADCVLTREVGQVNDKVPEMEGGKAQDIFLPQSPSLIDIMASVRAELERYEQMSGKEKKENSHIPLTMYGVAKRAAIDPRLVDASAADEPLSKTNKAVEETLRSLKETKKYNGTVAIFCDSYRNLQTGFNLFEDIKAKLVKGGVPAAKIAIIRSEMTDAAKQKIFDAVREGEIRVIMGSTQTLGTGVNIQTRLHTLIHMDAPDRPMDYTQRNGRIIRQGNMHRQWNIPVRVLRFGVEDSLDVTSYQRLKTKAGFIDSIMNGKSMIDNNLENRVLEDVDEGIFDNPVAMLSGSQYALLKSQAERDLRKWQARKQQHDIDQILIANTLKKNARIIEYRKGLIASGEKLFAQIHEAFPEGKVTEYKITQYGRETICHNKEELKEAIKALKESEQETFKHIKERLSDGQEVADYLALEYNGIKFEVSISYTRKSTWKDGQRVITVEKEVIYKTPISEDWIASPTKAIDKLIAYIEESYLLGDKAKKDIIDYSRSYIERLQQENELMRQREGKPFEHSAELEKAQALVDEYTEKMQDELAEKEAKYANMSSGRAVTLNEQTDEDETTPEAQITSLDYPQFANQTEAQQLATAALVEVLNDNTDLDVFLATDEEASQIMGDDNVEFSIRREPAPKKTGIGYKVFYRGNDGKLYPPMVANPNGEATPVGVWLNADAAPVAGESKTGRPQVKAGGKGTQGGSGQLAYRPGWHLGEIPYALQFNRKDENGEKTLFPKDFVWAEVEYAADNDYQEEAMREGVNTSGKFQHSLAGLKHVPTDGFYRYRTNPNPATDPWIITGAMKVNRILTNEEVDEIVRAAGREPQVREAMLTPNGTLYGWAIGDRIYLTKDGLNPNSPIHEYSHIWAKAMMRNNREGWQSIVNIFKGTPFWDEVVNDPNYQGLTTDDAICSEVLARYSGQRGAARMEEWAKEEQYEAEQSGSLLRGAKVRQLINRAKQALADFWHWVGVNLFGIKHFDSDEQVADRVLFDMLNQTELGDVTGGTTEIMISGYTQEKQRTINEWYAAHPRPQYQVGEKLEHYQARLEAWEKEYKQFIASMEQGRSNEAPIGESTPNPRGKDTQTPTGNGIQPHGAAPAFVPGVRPTLEKGETIREFSKRLQVYNQMMRDDKLISEYNAEINEQASFANTLKRKLVDSARPIEQFQKWMMERGAKITSESNAYQYIFLATGRVSYSSDEFLEGTVHPLARQIAKIIDPVVGEKKGRLDDLDIVWRNMDVPGTGFQLDGKKLTPRELVGVYCQAKDCAEAAEKGLPDRGAAGFRKNLGMSYEDIIKAVEARIPRTELDELWRLINAATHFALTYDYESGRITKETYTEFYQREFYVPQRGWRERDESGLITAYESVGRRADDPYNAALVKARGRNTLAADPFPYIMSIGNSSIISSENNKIKQQFLRFCLDNEELGLKSGAFRIKKYWIMNVIDPETKRVKIDEEGKPVVEVTYSAPSEEDYNNDRKIREEIKAKRKERSKVNHAYLERQAHNDLGPQLEAAYQTKLNKIDQAIEDLEQQMHIAWSATNTNITQRTRAEKQEHEIRVLLDGQEYLIEVQDEKLANSINKKFKEHQEEMFKSFIQSKYPTTKVGQVFEFLLTTPLRVRNLTRYMSAMLTQYNPEFAASNFARDYQVALATLAAEHPELLASFNANWVICQKAVWVYAFNDKVRGQKAFVDSDMGQYLKEYFSSGAATGFSYMQDLKTLRKEFDDMVTEGNWRKGVKASVNTLSMLTEVSETAVRFAAYVAARKKGWEVNDAAFMSKELTTNFDRAGEVADRWWFTSFSFLRATINGNVKFLKAFKKMPVAYSIIGASYFVLGLLNQLINPDDPEDEIWASEYTRESNYVLGKIRIPVAHFMRMYFGAGVNFAQWIQGNKSFGESVYKTADFAFQEMLPNYFNPMNATEWDSDIQRMDYSFDALLQGVMPTIVSPITDVYFNRDFRGATINRRPFTLAQEGTKDILLSKENTLPVYKFLTQAIYEGVGGNMNAKYQSDDPAWRSWLFDTSASSVEHVVEGYMPAGMDMFISLGEAIYDAATGTPTGPDKWPFVRKFYNAYTPERAYMQQYYLLNGRVQEFKRNMDDYQKNDFTKYNNLINSQEYRNYLEAEPLVKNQKENPTTADVQALINANKQWIK